ncbi:uncharacterized protein LOC129583368 [Paramacrobiotus metropolitanus]|uniref:uncharacterized protein LOC129583368 n=1 Tax=Paramacrobiotus metropolitanus TaxID=2943436 RepID=UPI0024461CA4|nr:uncharacterized protein LOC129583368 [Paramacrobiotus metropolitanus]
MLIIKEDQLEEFCGELQHLLPQSFPILKLAQNHLKKNSFAWPGLEFVVDRFPNFTACLVRPRPGDPTYVPRRCHYLYSAIATDVENFKMLLDQPDLVNWKTAVYFQAIPEDLLGAVEEVCSKHGSTIGPKQHLHFSATGWTVKPAEIASMPQPPIEGFTFRRPDRDDMPVLSKLWRYGGGTDETLQYLYHLHDHHFPMMGIYKEQQLVGFGIITAEMAMSAGYVQPEIRGRGLAGGIIGYSAKDMQEIGETDSFMFISEDNVASKKVFTKGAGAVRQEDWRIVDVLYKPHNVDKNDPLMIWYNNIHGDSQN